MIQPLKSTRTIWTVYWLDLDEPVASSGDIFLPTMVIVCDQSGIPITPPAILEEVDQIRVENLLLRLFDAHGLPDRLIVSESEDWDHEAWKGFAKDQGLELSFRNISFTGPEELGVLTKSVVQKFSDVRDRDVSELVNGLLAALPRIRSQRKRAAMLRKALEIKPDSALARIEMADSDFHQGKWKACLAAYEQIIRQESERLRKTHPHWWRDPATRPLLRAMYGRAMTLWHRGRYAEAADQVLSLLKLNPTDNQGVRFFLPMLYLLAEDLVAARAAFADYESRYPDDYQEPSLLFGWGLCKALEGDESAARKKYRHGILRNLFIAPLLLEDPPPSRHLWLPNDRAEPNYAQEFLESYAVLWDREPGALRLLREVWSEMHPRIRKMVAHRERMLDFQDQRYLPNYKAAWQELVDADDALISEGERE